MIIKIYINITFYFENVRKGCGMQLVLKRFDIKIPLQSHSLSIDDVDRQSIRISLMIRAFR